MVYYWKFVLKKSKTHYLFQVIGSKQCQTGFGKNDYKMPKLSIWNNHYRMCNFISKQDLNAYSKVTFVAQTATLLLR